MQDTRTLLQKADLALSDLVSDGGYLPPEKAQQFIKRMIRKPKLSGMVTVTTMESPTSTIPNIRFASQVLQPGVSGEALAKAQRSKPDLAKQTWNAQLFKAQINIPDEVLEDNIEGDGLKNTIMNAASEACGRDAEKVMIQGDTSSPDPLLAQLNGIIVQCTTNTVGASNARLTQTILLNLLKKLPKEYLEDRANLAVLTSINAETDYNQSLTALTADSARQGILVYQKSQFLGIPIEAIPMFPETLGGSSNQTVAILTNPKNIYLGFWRKIKVQTQLDAPSGNFIIVISMRFDVRFAVEDASAKTYEVLNS